MLLFLRSFFIGLIAIENSYEGIQVSKGMMNQAWSNGSSTSMIRNITLR